MRKIVLDTSVVIQKQKEIEKLIGDNELIICTTVCDELDNMKESDSPRRKYNGRSGLRFIKKHEDIFTYVVSNKRDVNDDSIIEIAEQNNAIIATKDRGMYVRCLAKGIEVLNLEEKEELVNYDGYKIVKWDFTDDDVVMKLNKLAEDETENIFDLQINEFVILKDISQPIFNEDGIQDDYKIESIMQWNGEKMIPMKYKNLNNNITDKVKPRNLEQKMLFSLMQNDNIKIVLATGTYGVGKDYVMLTNALELVQKSKYEKIVWFRNTVQVKGVQELGFLPGTLEDKLSPYSAILDDVIGDEFGTDMLIKSGKLEIGNLGAVRGRTFKNSIVYLTEAQNCTTEIIQLLISRMGENSIFVLNGDFHQIDANNIPISSLNETIDVLSGQPEFGWVKLNKIERSKVADLARLFDER